LLKIGKTITFEYTINLIEKDGEELAIEQKVLNMLSFEIDNIKSIDIIKSENDFSAQVNSVPLTKLMFVEDQIFYILRIKDKKPTEALRLEVVLYLLHGMFICSRGFIYFLLYGCDKKYFF
jgi:hypothetical protein